MTFLLAIATVLAFGLVIGGAAYLFSYIEHRCDVRRRIRERDCAACAKCGTYKCPSLHLCYDRKEKPYFELSEEYGRKHNG